MPFNKCFVHATRGGELEEVEEVTVPVLSLLDDNWCTYSEHFIERMAGQARPWFLYHCTRGAHFDNYPHPDFLGARRPSIPTRTPDRTGRDLRPTGRRARADRSTRVDAGRDLLRQRARDGDVAGLSLHALSLCEGVDVGGRCACAGRRVVAGHDCAEVAQRRTRASPRSLRHLPSLAGAPERIPSDRYIDAVDQLSFLLAPDDHQAVSNRKFQHYWLTAQYSALRVGEYKYMLSSISDDDTES